MTIAHVQISRSTRTKQFGLVITRWPRST